MKIQGGGTFIRFGADKQDNIKLPVKVERRLKAIAKKFNADVKVAKQMYQALKGLKNLKLTDEQIFKTIEHDLDPNSPKMTTMALGEEGGKGGDYFQRPPVEDDNLVTTLALGEEGGDDSPPPSNPPVTTLALGEEGGGDAPPPSNPPVTTMALGEEGGGDEPPRRPPITTMALGEEGGGDSFLPRPKPRSPKSRQ